MIDPEAIAVAVLNADDLGAVGELTDDPTRPAIRVTAAGGAPSSSRAPDWLVSQDLQFDVWGSSKVEAQDLAAEVRRLMLAAPAGTADYDPPAVIISTTMTPPTWVPDEDWPLDGRPGPRYLMFGTLTAHPKE